MARFDDAFGKFTYGVYAVGAKHEGKVNAMTCAWVTRVSFSPPMVAVAVGKNRYTHDMIKGSGAFSVNVLAEDQVGLGKHFGLRSGRHVDKFADVPYKEGVTGSPIIEGVAAWLDCNLVHAYDAGDHTIFVGEVVDADITGRRPLVFNPRDYWG